MSVHFWLFLKDVKENYCPCLSDTIESKFAILLAFRDFCFHALFNTCMLSLIYLLPVSDVIEFQLFNTTKHNIIVYDASNYQRFYKLFRILPLFF